MTFHKSPTRRVKNGFKYTRYTDETWQYAVERSKWLGKAPLPVVWRAIGRDGSGNWSELISRHRTRQAAEKALAKHVKHRNPRIGA